MTAERPETWGEFLVAHSARDKKMDRPKPVIVIGVCTRQRNALLRRLILSIWAQPVPAGYQVEIVVVDNNDRPVAAEALAGLSGRFPVSFVHEPQAGLAFARNRALDAAAMRSADWFIGVDDDEWVAPDWLAKFIEGIETLARSILIATCRYVYDSGLSPFLQPIQMPCVPMGARPFVMASGNFAIHRRVFDAARGPGLRFDPAFNETGGEDLEFFLRAERLCGWEAAGWPDAVVFENWNGARATLRYRLSRSLRSQVSVYRVAQRHRRLGYHGSRIANLLRILRQVNRHVVYGIGGLVAGLALLPIRPRNGRHRIGCALERVARALAVVPFVLGNTPAAYGRRAQLELFRG